MFCEKCGKNIAEGTKFCDGCGAKIDAPTSSVHSSPITPLPSTGGSTGTSVAGLIMAFFNVILAVYMRFNLSLWRALDEEEFYAFAIPLAIVIAIFSILLAVNHKKRDSKSVIYPTVIASIIFFILALIVILVES